jgi:hypothetical protein
MLVLVGSSRDEAEQRAWVGWRGFTGSDSRAADNVRAYVETGQTMLTRHLQQYVPDSPWREAVLSYIASAILRHVQQNIVDTRDTCYSLRKICSITGRRRVNLNDKFNYMYHMTLILRPCQIAGN